MHERITRLYGADVTDVQGGFPCQFHHVVISETHVINFIKRPWPTCFSDNHFISWIHGNPSCMPPS